MVAKMKSLTKILASATLSASVLLSNAQESPKPESVIKNVFVNSGWHSKYLGSYGFSATETPVIQSDIGFSLGKFNFDSWSNYDLKREKLTEIDNTLSLSLKSGNYNVSPSIIHFNSPSKDFGDCLELGVRVSRTDLPLHLSLFAGHLFGDGIKPGQAYNLRLGKSLKLSERFSANLQTDLWFNNHYFTVGSGFSHAAAKGSLDFNLGKGVSAQVYAKAQKAIDSHGGTFKDNSSYGLSFTKSF